MRNEASSANKLVNVTVNEKLVSHHSWATFLFGVSQNSSVALRRSEIAAAEIANLLRGLLQRGQGAAAQGEPGLARDDIFLH